MGWSNQVFNYCERAQDPGFWAEPLNAASNLAFVVTFALCLREVLRRANGGLLERSDLLWLSGLTGLALLIGAGSFLFHTFATRWALLADVVPISIFMVAYLAFALRRFLGLSWGLVSGILPLFLLIGAVGAEARCGAVSDESPGTPACLNGSLGYVPSLVALGFVGFLAGLRSPAGRLLIGAATLFLVSVSLRTLDFALCGSAPLLGYPTGTHALWHVLNAVVIYLLIRAALEVTVKKGRGAPERNA